ncbi:putative transcription factor C2H2 family [Helianthus annuus]|nr:putative transcription factor C2H2 family [Helianthus annuus]
MKWACNFLLHQCLFHHQNLQGLASSLVSIERTYIEQVECMICLSTLGEEEEDIRELGCGHLFHEACVDLWFRFRNTTCPLCRDCLVLPRVVSGKIYWSLIFVLPVMQEMMERGGFDRF